MARPDNWDYRNFSFKNQKLDAHLHQFYMDACKIAMF
jgi:hypothetical protein